MHPLPRCNSWSWSSGEKPLSPIEQPGGVGVNCELFELGVEQFVVSLAYPLFGIWCWNRNKDCLAPEMGHICSQDMQKPTAWAGWIGVSPKSGPNPTNSKGTEISIDCLFFENFMYGRLVLSLGRRVQIIRFTDQKLRWRPVPKPSLTNP